MERLWLALGFAAVAAVAVLKLAQLRRWTRVDAVFLGIGPDGQVPWMVHTGQMLPIAFQLPDGRTVTEAVRLYNKSSVPAVGGRVRIIYDPADPSRVEPAGVILFAGAAAVLTIAGCVTMVATGVVDWVGASGASILD